MRLSAAVALLAIAQTVALAQNEEPQAPKQPIAFNHKLHVTTLKQPCQSCHANTDPGEMVDMPDTAKCLGCHSGIEPKTQAERKLAAFGKQNKDVDWVRVYQIPTFVRFDHRQHSQAGVKCEACHGMVAQRVALWREKEVSMGACTSCHQTMKASLDCGSCHSPR